MTITKKLVFWLICIAIIPLMTFRHIVSGYLTRTIKAYAVEEAKGQAELVAMAITAEPPLPSSQPSKLQNFIETFHRRDKRKIVVVDKNMLIVADSNADHIGTVFTHDMKNEVGQTLKDGEIRTFVEKSADYAGGIHLLALPLFSEGSQEIAGAVIHEYGYLLHNLTERELGVAKSFAQSLALSISALLPVPKPQPLLKEPKKLQKFINDFQQREKRDIVVLDKNSLTMAGTLSKANWIKSSNIKYNKENIKKLLNATVTEGSRFTFEGKSNDGSFEFVTVPLILENREIAGALILEYSTLYAAALRTIRRFDSISGMAIAVIGMAVALFAVFIARTISKPIKSLSLTAAAIGAGDLSRMAEVKSKDEIGELAASFNLMTENLRNTTTSVDNLHQEIAEREKVEEELAIHRQQLEKLVAERTAKLSSANKQLLWEVAERERVEKALRQSEQELKIRNEISNIFFTTSEDQVFSELLQVILTVMESKYGFFGYLNERGDFVVAAMNEISWANCKMDDKSLIFTPDKWFSCWGKAIKEKKMFCCNGPYNLPEGHVPILRDMSMPINYKGRLIGLIAIANKDTDYDWKDKELMDTVAAYVAPLLYTRLQKDKQNKALRESEERYRSLVENINLGIISLDKEFNILMSNTAQSKFLGKDLNEVVGKKCYAVVKKLNKPCSYCPGVHAMETRSRKELEKEIVLDNGSKLPILIRAFPSFDSHREVIGFVQVIEDISVRKQVEVELESHRQGLEELVAERTAELTRSNEFLWQEINERRKVEEKLNSYQKQLRSLASEVSLVEERERRRIAVGLHDDIGQNLYIAKIKLEALQVSLSSIGLDRSLEDVINYIEQTIHRARSLTFELSPPVLYELGFEPALEWLTERIYEQHGILPLFEDDKQPKPLDLEVMILLYQSVRELLVNIVKHARATSAKVSVMRKGDEVRIDVTDDGVGFDFEEATYHVDKDGVFGLFSIRERLDYLGGYLEVKSKPGKGTMVSLITPLCQKEELVEETVV